MSELSCDTPFIGRNETHDLIRSRLCIIRLKLTVSLFLNSQFSLVAVVTRLLLQVVAALVDGNRDPTISLAQ